jgi:TonB-dependent receptor
VNQPGNTANCTPGPGSCPAYFAGAHNSFADPYNSFWRSAMDHAEDSEGTEDALRFDIDHKWSEDGFFRGQKFGGRWAERDQTTRNSTYNWGVLSEIWGGGGPVWFDDPIDGIPNGNNGNLLGTPTAPQTGAFAFDNFMRGQSPVPAVVPFYNATDLVGGGYAALTEFALQVSEEWRLNNGTDNTWEPLSDTRRASGGPQQNAGFGGLFLPREINNTVETTESLYYMLKFGSDLSDGKTFSGNIGVRWVRTDFDATGVQAAALPGALPSEATCNPAPPAQVPTGFCQIPLAERQRARRFATGESTDIVANKSYDEWLPSLNLKFGLSDELLLRFGYSKAMARPDLGLMRYYSWVEPYVVNNVWQGWQIRTGNPFLEPTTSNQIDTSVEWYFARASSLTFSLFYKELENVLTNEVTLESTTYGGETYDVRRPSPINSDETGKVKGFELAYQQFYDMLPGWLGGFGIQANYTYIDSDGVTQSVLSSGGSTGVAENEANVDTSLLPLVGLSEDNANFALIYERGPISARAAYNYRSEFLLTTRDVITPFAPIMQEASGQLDASFFYSINDHVKIGIQGVNLTNEITETSQVLNDDLVQAGRSWFMNDRRYSIGLRVNF